MNGSLGHQLICRTCLSIVENKTQSFGFIEDATGNIKDMIMCCMPEMDIYVSTNPIICFPCIQLLVTVYNFKTRCLNTETVIRSYIKQHNLDDYNHVNLSCVVQELITLDNIKKEQQRRISAEKQMVESTPYISNDVSEAPYEILRSPLRHCRLPDSQGIWDVPDKYLSNENIPRDCDEAWDQSPNGIRSHFMISDELVRRNQDLLEQQKMLQNLPQNPNLSEPQILMNDDEVLLSDSVDKEQTTLNEIVEHSSQQNNQGVAAYPVKFDMKEYHFNQSENEIEKIKNNLELSDEQQSETSTKGITNSDLQSNGGSPPTKNDMEKETVAENRPRLIIKISKNKITLPPDKNEDSNEKENEKMDIEAGKMETPTFENGLFETDPPLNEGQNIYQCPNCTFLTTNLNYYEFHSKICGQELSEKKCPHCPHVTNRQNALKKHINTMHTRATWYTCDFCPYRSTDSSCLRRHKRNIHPDNLGQELMCNLCAYRCTTEYHLKKHMQKHEANSALECQFCSYSTRDRSNFRKHVFIHNPKPQACEFCNYKCVSPYQMKLHLKKFHHGVGLEDVDCRSEVSISEVVQDISAAIKEAKRYVGHQQAE